MSEISAPITISQTIINAPISFSGITISAPLSGGTANPSAPVTVAQTAINAPIFFSGMTILAPIGVAGRVTPLLPDTINDYALVSIAGVLQWFLLVEVP
jgi:hypothetical protein